MRIEHIVPDVEDICDTHELFIFPSIAPERRSEGALERFFVIVHGPAIAWE